uniref:HDC07236 n=1 Tax=Drosophila melanogaster TaxID=7227 RepID=Q6IG49_DROME|nr:TPA_inf: HDC07236 [Drosophila melanogaster]
MPRSRFLTIASGMDEGQSGGAQELQLQQFSERANFPPMSDENAKENRAKLNKRNSTAFDFDNLRIDLENSSSIELEHSPYENDVKTRGGKCIWDGVS